jgi:hypothetical protein
MVTQENVLPSYRWWLPRVLGCYVFILVICLPLQFAFSSGNLSLAFTFLIITSLFTLLLLLTLLSKRVDRTASKIRRDLIYATCVVCTTSLPGIPAYSNYMFAMGLYNASINGKIDDDSFIPSRKYLAYSMFLMLGFNLFLRIITNDSTTVSQFFLVWLGPPCAFAVGQVLGLFLNRCIPPLMDVGHEITYLGRVLGGYAFGYLVITAVFAGLYASAVKLDMRALNGVVEFRFVDYWFLSTSILTTLGSTVEPITATAKIIVAIEVLLGVAWTVVVFAAVLSAFQKRHALVDNSAPKPETSAKPVSSQE